MITVLDTTIALCHNDLSWSNILLNPEEEDVLAGIIDFGNTVVMPKYQDFFPLYKISRKLAIDTMKEYNKITSSPIEQKQMILWHYHISVWDWLKVKMMHPRILWNYSSHFYKSPIGWLKSAIMKTLKIGLGKCLFKKKNPQ